MEDFLLEAIHAKDSALYLMYWKKKNLSTLCSIPSEIILQTPRPKTFWDTQKEKGVVTIR